MVTKAMLQEAAGIAENRRLQSIENMPQVEHQFSARFERKMNRLIRQVEHPVRHAFFRSVAAVLLLVFILFGMVFAISPEVRASVIGWVRSAFFEYSKYSKGETSNSDDVAYEYRFHEIPEGYLESDVLDIMGGRTYVFTNQSDDYVLFFTYLKGDKTKSLFIKTDLHSHVKDFVNDNSADVYISDSDIETNAIVWYVEETETLFCISGRFDQKTLVTLAESIVKSEK